MQPLLASELNDIEKALLLENAADSSRFAGSVGIGTPHSASSTNPFAKICSCTLCALY